MRHLLLIAGLGLLLAPALPSTAQARGDRPGTFTCSSNDRHYRECDIPFPGRAVLVENLSGTRCLEGRTWGYRNGRIWVDDGCRGRFAQAGGPRWDDRRDDRHDDRGPSPRWRDYSIVCASKDRHASACGWDRRAGWPRVVQQLSGTPCIEGRNWGYQDGKVWVDDGCRARFGGR